MAKSKPRKKRPVTTPFNKMEAIKPFIIRLHELCKAINCDVMQYIVSKEDMLALAGLRFRIGSIDKVTNEYKHTRPYKSIFNKIIKQALKTHLSVIKDFPIQTCFLDVTYFDALTIFLENNLLENKSLSDKFLDQIKAYYDSSNKKFYSILQHQLIQITLLENLPDEAMLSFGYTPAPIHTHKLYNAELSFQLYLQRPIKEYITFKGQTRLAYKVIIPIFTNKLYHETVINTKLTDGLYQGDKESLHIFIQAHALQRFRERTAPFNDMFIKLQFSLCMLNEIKPICRSESLYIPYRINDITIGYFVGIIAEEKVMIKTFILATHASAPEGHKFQELTGFKKHDMSYWDITKLDTFIYNDMKPENPLYAYFEESGLLPMFDLDDKQIMPEDKCDKQANWQNMLECINKQHTHKNLSQQDFQNTILEEVMS